MKFRIIVLLQMGLSFLQFLCFEYETKFFKNLCSSVCIIQLVLIKMDINFR